MNACQGLGMLGVKDVCVQLYRSVREDWDGTIVL